MEVRSTRVGYKLTLGNDFEWRSRRKDECYLMQINIPAGTASTMATILVPSNKLEVVGQKPGETVYIRTDATIGRESNLRVSSRRVRAADPKGLAAGAVTGEEVQVLVQLTETWDNSDDATRKTDEVSRASAHLVLKAGYKPGITAALIKAHLERLLGVLAGADGASLETNLESLIRGRTDLY